MLAAFLVVITLAHPGAKDTRSVIESWVGPTVEDFADCAMMAADQNTLHDYLYEKGLSKGVQRHAVCEVGEADERVADINKTRFDKAMTAPEMVPIKF